MNYIELVEKIKEKKSFLCVGLDPQMDKIPTFLHKENDPIFEFNKRIIDSTYKYAVAYKPNIAFYEALGQKGWESLEKTLAYIPKDIFTIADAKRGDIGNTSNLYAQAFFKNMNFDSITVAPYMGRDSVEPFLKYDGKWVILLVATSNVGGADFQQQQLKNGKMLYENVLETSKKWSDENNLMYVVGATRPTLFKSIREQVPTSFLLVPGIGSQGGDFDKVCEYGMNENVGLLVNLSRGIIYVGKGNDFQKDVEKKTREIQQKMQEKLTTLGII